MLLILNVYSIDLTGALSKFRRMNNCCIQPLPPKAGVQSFASHRLTVLLSLLVAAWFGLSSGGFAAENDELYLKIYNLIEQADELAAKAKPAEAKAKYLDAQKQLRQFKQTFPTYNTKTVNYRLKDLETKIDALSKPAPVPEETATTVTAATPKPAKPNGLNIKLLTPGAEPRTVLRFQPQPGDKQALELVLKTTMGMEMPGQAPAQEVKVPALKMNLDTEVKEVFENGDIVYTIHYGQMSLQNEKDAAPEVVQALKTALGNFHGLSGLATNTSRGLNKGLAAQIQPGTDAQTHQMVDQMNDSLKNITTPLPEEAIGVGAKWETKMPIKSQGMTIEQNIMAELVGLEQDRATIKFTANLRAANQKVSNPSLPGLKMDLDKMSGKSEGESTISLKQLLPAKASLNQKTEIVMGFNAGKQKQSMKMNMDIQMTLQSQ